MEQPGLPAYVPLVTRGASASGDPGDAPGRSRNGPSEPPGRDAVGPLVERDDAQAVLRAVQERVAAGQGRGLLVMGQPGVGKTALLTHALAQARGAGFTVVSGQAHAAERGLAYAAVVDAFGPDLDALGAGGEALTRGLPELGTLFRGLAGRGEAPAGAAGNRRGSNATAAGRRETPSADPALERMRLVDALGRLFERMTSRAPVLFALDDLHWADPATLSLVHHLLRRMEGDRFLLLATARDGEPAASGDGEGVGDGKGEGEPGGDRDGAGDYGVFLASARRLALVDELVLGPLSAAGVAAMLARLLPPARPGAELVRLVHQRSGGIPLFVAALASSLSDAGGLVAVDGVWELARDAGPPALPPALHRLLDDRLRRLDSAARNVLNVLAVHDGPLEHTVVHAAVHAVAGMTETDLLDALGRLFRLGMVGEDASGPDVTYSVSHALLAEAATAGMAALARRRLHLAVAEALQHAASPAGDAVEAVETVETVETVEAVARHLKSAGSLAGDDRVVPALRAAADAATRRGDFRLAAGHLDEVVARLRAVPDRPGRQQDLPQMVGRLADARYRSGNVPAAVSAWRECLDAAERNADLAACVTLHRQLAMAERDRGRLEAAGAHLDAATAAARAMASAAVAAVTESRPAAMTTCRRPTGLAQAAQTPTWVDQTGDASRSDTQAGPTREVGASSAGTARPAHVAWSDAEAKATPAANAAANAAANTAANAELLLARSLADRFTVAERMEDLPAAETAAEALAALARHNPSRLVVMEAALTRAGLERARRRLAAATAAAEEALAVARAAGRGELELRALGVALEVAIEAGAHPAIRRHADATLALARSLGVPAFELRALGARSAAGLFDGDWRGSDRDLVGVLAISRAFEIPRGLAGGLALRGLLYLYRGDLAAAEGTIGEATRHQAAVPDDRHVAGDVAHARCRLAIERGDGTRARDLVPALLRPGGRVVALRQATAAEALILSGRPGEALDVVDLLLAGSPGPYQQALADRVAGMAYRALCDDRAARRRLEAAALGFTEQGVPCWAALARLELAECVEPAPARSLAQESLEVFDRVGARRSADRARRLLRRLGARPRPAPRAARVPGPLSARELEVARLFADGLTTAEVAARLVLSPHTVTAHLRRIYERLGVRSRATLTRTLAQAGLLTPE